MEATAENIKREIERNPPRSYQLSDQWERARLFREVAGYLRTCQLEHHGTDWAGRSFALDAIEVLARDARETAELNMRLRGAGL